MKGSKVQGLKGAEGFEILDFRVGPVAPDPPVSPLDKGGGTEAVGCRLKAVGAKAKRRKVEKPKSDEGMKDSRDEEFKG